jgi:hypothetical protein
MFGDFKCRYTFLSSLLWEFTRQNFQYKVLTGFREQ